MSRPRRGLQWCRGRCRRVFAAITTGCMVFASLSTSGCTAIELEPEPPALAVVEDPGPDASELVVAIRASPTGFKAGWAVLVDGKARAWLPNTRGYTRLAVAPGHREVTVSLRTRWINVVILPFPDWGDEHHASVTVHCSPRARCGLGVEGRVDQRRGMFVTAEVAGPELLAAWIESEGLSPHPAAP